MRRRTLLLALSVLLAMPIASAGAAEPSADPPADESLAPAGQPLDPTGRYIVLLDPKADAKVVRDRHAKRDGVKADRLFQRAVRGFAGVLSPGQVKKLEADPDVVAVVPDEVVEVASQLIPTGVRRVGAHASGSTVARIDGIDQRVDADVAVVDTGIDPTHPDLNVVGGINCSTSDPNLWRDVQGHGTHVAGTIGAIDNGAGVVGVAPGVRLWAVKILNDDGFGYLSWYVCGLDWIAAQKDPNDASRPLIEAVNMSVAKWGKDGGSCGATTNDILHQAICRVTTAGVTVVAAAANDAGSAAARVPAAYDEVITVSALADTDGKAGALGGNRCWSWGGYDQDDTFADFSNYGSDVDLIAPGKCIWSTLPGNRYGYSSGTSMAAPAVTGAAALYLASRPWARPGPVKGALQALGSTNWLTSTDPDTMHERLLNVSRLGPAGSFSVGLGTPAPLGEAGGTLNIPVTISRSATHFEALSLLSSAPTGFTAALDRSLVSGFGSSTAVLTVIVPPSTPAGRYPVTVQADEGARTHTASVEVVIESDAPVAAAPSAVPAYKSSLGSASTPLRVTWAPATDATSAIAGYELQSAVDGGDWSAPASYGPATRSIVRSVVNGRQVQFRVRARDAAGNWSEWAAGSPVRVAVVDDRSSLVRRSSAWSALSYRYAYNGTFLRTYRTAAVVRATVTARTLAIVAPVGPRSGWLRIYVDGAYQGQITLYSRTGASRRILWVRTFATDGPKAVELRSVRSSSRYKVELDAIVAVR